MLRVTVLERGRVVDRGTHVDLLGRDAAGNFKAKHQWLTETAWDLVVFDEYHFGAWRDTAKELFEGEDEAAKKKETESEFSEALETFAEELEVLGSDEDAFVPIRADAYLYLSGTPFKALATGRFIEEQIFNWTYTDEQRAKAVFAAERPGEKNPYGALPEMRLFTYQMPEELTAVASGGEFDEFDLNTFFEATGSGADAQFVHKDDVQKWLDIIRGSSAPTQIDALKAGTRPPFPYSDTRLLPYLQHSIWMLPRTASCAAMVNLLAEKHNVFWHDYDVVNVSASGVGVGLDALPPVRTAIGAGHNTKTITLTVGKLTTGVTVPQWSSILMLRNLKAPETYFQAAFRVQSPWTISNPDGDDPRREDVGVVAARDGGEGVGALDAGLQQRVPVEADTGDATAAELAAEAAEGGRVLVDDGDVVPDALERACERGTDAAAAHDDEVHGMTVPLRARAYTRVVSSGRLIKRVLVGRAMRSDHLGETLLPKKLALPVFASDALSSVAYAPDEILLTLGLAGGALAMTHSWPVALGVVAVMAVVVASYRQNVHAYPSGGGDYEVASTNLGRKAGLTVASALLVDYVLTVAVSISSGVQNAAAALPWIRGHEVLAALVLIAALTGINLRGVRESGKAFAIPTYLFMLSVIAMGLVGVVRRTTGTLPQAESGPLQLAPEPGMEQLGTLAMAFLLRQGGSATRRSNNWSGNATE